MIATKHPIQKITHELKFRLVEVRRRVHLTRRTLAVTFGGDDLNGFTSAAFDNHVKIFFPPEGENRPATPTLGPAGIVFPEGAPKPPYRDYTPRRYDPAANELDIEFDLHGDGPASRWAAQAAPGQKVGIAGPRGSLIVPNDFDWYFLAGDETAIPAIGRRLEELPAGSFALVAIEVEDKAEERKLKTSARVDLNWVHRGRDQQGISNPLLAVVRQLQFPAGDSYAWAAGESDAIRMLRRHLIEERGLAREWMKTAGYWRRGTSGVHDKHVE